MSTKLTKYLFPKGRSTIEPDLMPNVQDSDNNAVLYNSAKRKTTEGTVVDLGDSPNSNNGDPLRTAFAKINNFIEAAYWWDEGINQKFRDIDSELNEGIKIIGSDSDERYSISLLGDSIFYVDGKDGQIETNFSRKKSVNNTNDWDSEVRLTFQLAHTLETYNVNVNEFFTIKDSDGIDRVTYRSVDYPTTYNERAQNGRDVEFNIGTNVVLGRDSDDVVVVNGRVASNLIPYGDEIYNLGDSDNKWKDLYLSGNTIYLGSIQIKNNNNRGLLLLDSEGKTLNLTINEGRASTLQVDSDMLVDGLLDLAGRLTVSERASFDSEVIINHRLLVSTIKASDTSGTITFDDDVTFVENVNFDSDVNISGNVTASGFKTTNPAGMVFEDDVIFYEHATFDSDVTMSADLRVDSDVTIKGELVVGQQTVINDSLTVTGNVDLDSDVSIAGTLFVDNIKTNPGQNTLNFDTVTSFDSDVTVQGLFSVFKETAFYDDVIFLDNAYFDSDVDINGRLNVQQEVIFYDDVNFKDNAKFDSDVKIKGQLLVQQEATFEDDVVFTDHVRFDSDVSIMGSLTVNGTANFLNPNQLQVSDNLIVLNYGQPTPFNDTGIIFSRYDSDNVSAVNWNTKMMWDETQDQFVFGQTSSSGITPNPDTTQTYLEVGDRVELFDSENDVRMVWDKAHARLSILNGDNTEVFAVDADSGQIEGNGTIDAGSF